MKLPRLSKLELHIMEALWEHGASSVREIQEAFPEDNRPAYTTVQTMVYRLEAKNAVRRVKKIGNAHIFEALVTRNAAQRRLIDELLGFFGGSSQPVMAHLIESGKLTLEDVQEAEQTLRRLKEGEVAMIEQLGEHLWQSTLFLLVAALLTLAFRENRARIRYWIWFAASLKFLVPFAALVAIGQQLSWLSPRIVHVERLIARDAPGFFPPPGSFNLLTAPVADASASLSGAIPMVLGIWFLGTAVMLARWWMAWRRLSRLARTGTAVCSGRELETVRRLEPVVGITKPLGLVASDSLVEPGVFGVLAPVLLWPQGISDRLGVEQVEAILKHELCHVRGRDNLTAATHLIVEAIFWFHPLVWWVGARLVEERERACDEDVVQLGSEPEVYAESILKTCQFYVESPLACMAGVTGSNLKKRMERIMKNEGRAELSFKKKWGTVAVAVTAVAAPIVVGAATPPAEIRRERVIIRLAHAEAAQAPTPAFEVASVKPNKSADGRVVAGMPPGGRFTATRVTLRMLIRQAYQLQDFQMAGGPDWIDSDRFDVDARAGGYVGPTPLGTVGPMHLMLQSLLAERFQLRVHTETREQPLFSLVLARKDGRRGPQLRPAGEVCAPVTVPGGVPAPPPPPPAPQAAGDPLVCPSMAGPWFITGRRMAMAQLASGLAARVGRVVVDRTGVDGHFDLELTFTPDDTQAGQPIRFNGVELDLNAPSIYTAVQEQLGLRLDSQRGPVEVLVIDSVEQPTDN